MTPPTLMALSALHACADAAMKLGLFSALLESSQGEEDLVALTGLDALAVNRTLTVLVAGGIVINVDGVYSLHESTRRELLGPGGVGGKFDVWARLPTFLKTGETLVGPGNEMRSKYYPEVVSRLIALMASQTVEFAQHIAPLLPDAAQILDVGTGAGAWSLPLLQVREDAQLTGLDLEAVLPRLKEEATQRGIAERVRGFPADFHDVELTPGTFDLVIAANVLHLESAPVAERLVRKWMPAVKPGGLMVIVDVMQEAGDPDHLTISAYALHLALRLPEARPHPECELRYWLSQAGAVEISKLSLGSAHPRASALVATI